MRLAWWLMAFSAVGCKGSALDAGDGSTGTAPRPDLAETASEGAFCSSPISCNDDPSMSAPAGTCRASNAGQDGSYCVCKDGFSINPATGRCRTGTSCVASGADPWPTTVMLDYADCATRALASCQTAATTQMEIDMSVLMFARAICHLPNFYYLRVELVSGCPSLMNVKGVRGAIPDPQVVDCLARELPKQRWSCTDGMACSLVEYDTLAP
jgi:hypothetical protein